MFGFGKSGKSEKEKCSDKSSREDREWDALMMAEILFSECDDDDEDEDGNE